MVVNNQSTDFEMMRLLARVRIKSCVSCTRSPAAAPMEHRTAWLQVMEGTPPFVYVHGHAGRDETDCDAQDVYGADVRRQRKADSRDHRMAPAKPETVAIFRLRGNDWKRGLIQDAAHPNHACD
jgi:hypothetical protein